MHRHPGRPLPRLPRLILEGFLSAALLASGYEWLPAADAAASSRPADPGPRNAARVEPARSRPFAASLRPRSAPPVPPVDLWRDVAANAPAPPVSDRTRLPAIPEGSAARLPGTVQSTGELITVSWSKEVESQDVSTGTDWRANLGEHLTAVYRPPGPAAAVHGLTLHAPEFRSSSPVPDADDSDVGGDAVLAALVLLGGTAAGLIVAGMAATAQPRYAFARG